jgi:hypothetical protein
MISESWEDNQLKKYKEFLDSILKEPPANVTTEFKVGDKVTFTNIYGVAFEGKPIIGFAQEEFQFDNRFIYIDCDSYWFPHRENELKLEKV